MQKHRTYVLSLALIGILTALSLVFLAILPGIPLFPAADFLKYDAMDIPILIGAFIMGAPSGMAILLIGSAFQSFVYGHNGIVGFAMHVIASGALLLVSSLVYRHYRSRRALVAGLVLGCLAMTLTMIFFNYLVTGPYLEALGVANARALVHKLMLPAIVPFNLIKAGINALITGILVFALEPQINRLQRRVGLRVIQSHKA